MSSDVVKVYIGGLPPSADDSTIAELLSAYGKVESVSLSRDPSNLKNCAGYGFAKMACEEDVDKAVSGLHNQLKLDPESFPNHGPIQLRILRDDVSAISGASTSAKPTKVFIGGIPGSATGKTIRGLFQPYGEILDLFISPEKGYAFVKYSSKEDALSAINALNGLSLPNGVRPLEVRIAQSTKGMDDENGNVEDTPILPPKQPRCLGVWTEYFTPEGKAYYFNRESKTTTWDVPQAFVQPEPPPAIPTPQARMADKGPLGSNIFVYGIPNEWSEKEFAEEFSRFGSIISTKIVYDKLTSTSKGYGFISYTAPSAAEDAVESMHGYTASNGKKLKVQIKRGEEGRNSRPY